jgi:anti-sigma regulatory factor (Ser/Thr protein kinase)
MNASEQVLWTIPADIDRVGPLVLDTAGYLERRGVRERPLFRAQLLLEEIVTNVVRHAFGGDPSRGVRVQLTLDDDVVTLVVEDEGEPYAPFTQAPAPDLTAPLEQRRAGGLGVHLVRRMADEAVYERADGANRVRMRVNRERDGLNAVSALRARPRDRASGERPVPESWN